MTACDFEKSSIFDNALAIRLQVAYAFRLLHLCKLMPGYRKRILVANTYYSQRMEVRTVASSKSDF